MAAAVAVALQATGAFGGPRSQAGQGKPKAVSQPSARSTSKGRTKGKAQAKRDVKPQSGGTSAQRKGPGPVWTCGACGCEDNPASRAVDGLGCRVCSGGADRLAVLRATCWKQGKPLPEELPAAKSYAAAAKADKPASAETGPRDGSDQGVDRPAMAGEEDLRQTRETLQQTVLSLRRILVQTDKEPWMEFMRHHVHSQLGRSEAALKQARPPHARLRVALDELARAEEKSLAAATKAAELQKEAETALEASAEARRAYERAKCVHARLLGESQGTVDALAQQLGHLRPDPVHQGSVQRLLAAAVDSAGPQPASVATQGSSKADATRAAPPSEVQQARPSVALAQQAQPPGASAQPALAQAGGRAPVSLATQFYPSEDPEVTSSEERRSRSRGSSSHTELSYQVQRNRWERKCLARAAEGTRNLRTLLAK